MKRSIVGTLLLGGLLSVNAADENSHRFEETNEQFTITLTADWKKVDAKSAPYAGEVLSEESDIVSLAYQLGSDTNSAAMVFVQIDNNWRVPEGELARLQIDFLRKQFLTDRLEVEGLLDSSYDTNRHVLRISSSAETPGLGRLRFLESVHFTEKGSFIISCVAPSEHFKAAGAAFNRALDTFEIDPSLTYVPRPGAGKQIATNSGSGRVKIRFGWIFGLASVVLFIVHRLSNRVMSDEV